MSSNETNTVGTGSTPARANRLTVVTGASGFVGRHLVEKLSGEGEQVRALYHSNRPGGRWATLPGVTWQQCDLLDIYAVEEALAGAFEVYHCAAIVSFHPSDKRRMLHFNVESTTNVVNEALERGVRKLLYVSSIAALGRTTEMKEITEEEQWQESSHNSVYGMSKYLAELEVWRGAGEGLPAIIINPGIILGAGNWETGSARLMKVVDSEFPFYTRGINAWVDVRDVVDAAVALMKSEATEERVILSAGNYSYKDIFTSMAKALGRKPPHILAGPFLTGLVWRWNLLSSALFGKAVTVTRETARTAQKISRYNTSKLQTLLPGFRYRDIEDTISTMAAAYRKQD